MVKKERTIPFRKINHNYMYTFKKNLNTLKFIHYFGIKVPVCTCIKYHIKTSCIFSILLTFQYLDICASDTPPGRVILKFAVKTANAIS